jgi:futalosine hydrolase
MTMARLIPLIREQAPSLILNIGIAGAYPGSGLSIGDVVVGESEVFGDLGMELPGPEAFLPLGGMPWADPEYRQPLPLANPGFAGKGLRSVAEARGKGCTVNACAGTAATGKLRRDLFGVDFETMEGAAVALAGSLSGIPVAEVRCISNAASERDMRPANVDHALGNLGVYLRGFLPTLATEAR